MKINELIYLLEKVREAKGNISVQFNSFCGTNQGHVSFDIESDIGTSPDDMINGLGELCLSIKISDYTREQIIKGIKEMEAMGETFYLSQFVSRGKSPRSGLSPCSWHNPW